MAADRQSRALDSHSIQGGNEIGEKLCARADLQVIALRDTHFAVDDAGEDTEYLYDGELECFKCFYCGICMGCFAPDDANRQQDWDRAWQEAIDHTKDAEVMR